MTKNQVLFLFLFTLVGCAEKKTEVFTTDKGAINGYDPVAFFTDSSAVKGDKTMSTEWNGAMWCFSSAANLDAFKADPEKYAPQYGGWCAYGTADGHLSPTQAETWTVLNGKLYFNYNMEVKDRWVKDQPGYIEKANRNWPALRTQ